MHHVHHDRFLILYIYIALSIPFLVHLFYSTYSTYTTSRYYKMTYWMINFVEPATMSKQVDDDDGKKKTRKACESGWNPCDSRRKFSTVGHLGWELVTFSTFPTVTFPRCPTVEISHLLSHGYQPLSHAFLLSSYRHHRQLTCSSSYSFLESLK